MRYKVLKAFRDKDTKKVYKKGSNYNCSEERFEEIQGKGDFLSPVEKNEVSHSRRIERILNNE